MSIIYTVDPAEVASETNFHTIQEAIDAAAGVAGAGNPVEIRIAAGIYKEALTFPAGKGNITLSGARAGVDASSPERGTGETVLVGYILGADGGGALTNVTIDGMTIEAASQAQIEAGEIRNSGNVPYHGVIWSQYQSDGFTLKNNIITNAGNPAKGTIWLGAQENATITGNRVTTVLPDGEVKKEATLGIGGTSGTTTITGNVFDSAHNAVNLSGNNGGDITISGNHILNAAKCGIQVTSAPAGGSISITGNVIDNYGSAVSGKAEDEAAIAFQKRGGAGNEAVVTVTGNSVKGDYDVPLLFFSNNPADVAGSVIRDNVFQGGSSTGVYIKTSQGVQTADLAVADNFYLNAAGAQLTEVPAVQVESDSTVNTTPDPEAAVISPAVVVETGASVVIVDAAWAACEAGTLVMAGGKCYTIGVNAFGTVQAAADGVETGGTVRIQAGVYDENLMLTRSMTLLGAAGNGTVLNGGIGAAADHIVIDGLFIRPGSVNTVDANGGAAAGVSVEKHGITGLTVRNCRIDCSAAIGGNVKVYGITAGLGSRSYYSSAVTLENNRITGYTTGNAVSATAQNGIYLRFVSGATVSGNTVEGFSHHLMQFQAGSDATVTNNVVRDTDRNGIQFGATASGSNLVKGNAVSDCRGASSDDAAIVLRNDGTGSMTVTGNEVTGNKTGVYISEVTDVTQLEITGNIIDGNTIDIAGNSASDITLSGNNYGADGEAVVSQQGAGKLDPGASASAETATTSIFINPAWAGQTTVIGPDGKFYTVGVNAFTKVDAAVITADTLNLDVTGPAAWLGRQAIDLSGAVGKTTVTFHDITDSTVGAYRTYLKGNNSTVVTFDNVTAPCHIFMENLSEIALVGNSQLEFTTYNNNDSLSTPTFTNVGKLTVNAGTLCYFSSTNQYGLGETVISGAGTIKTAGNMLVGGNTNQFVGTLEIAGSVTMESVESGFANASQIINNGTMYCNAAGTMVFGQKITGSGMITARKEGGTEVVITGDLSGYTGKFDALSGNTIKLNTTLNDTVNLSHSGGSAGTVELNGDGSGKTVTVNSTTDTSTALKVFMNWNDVLVQANGNAETKVYGTIFLGSNEGGASVSDLEVRLSAMNLTGGSVGHIYLGGRGDTINDGDDADKNAIVLHVDSAYSTIYGAGENGTVNGDITINVTDKACGLPSAFAPNGQIYGGGTGNTINGNVNINVNAGEASVGDIFGANASGAIDGDINITLSSGKVRQLYGLRNGSASGSSVKNIVINVEGGSVDDIRGGNSSAGKVPGEFRADCVQINLTGGEVTGKLYGGSQLNAGRIDIVVDGASAGDIYAGSKYGTVGNTSVEVKSGTVSGSIYGGGAGGSSALGYSAVDNAEIVVSGGDVTGTIYGGGSSGDATGNASIEITGGEVNDISLGGAGGAVVNSTLKISGADTVVNGNITADSLSGDAEISITGTAVNGITMNAEGNNLLINNGRVEGEVSSDGALAISGKGVFTQAITAATLTAADGLTFEVSAADLAKPLVNLTGAEASTLGNITVKLTDGSLSDFAGKQLVSGNLAGDVNLTLSDGSSTAEVVTSGDLFVNSEWSSKKEGELVELDGKFYVIGKTAFASADEAAARAAAGDSVHIRSAALQTLGTGKAMTAETVYIGKWNAVSGDPDTGNVGSLTLGTGSRLAANKVYVGTANEVLGARSSQLIVESGAQLSTGAETLNIRYDGYVKFNGWDGKTVSNVTIFNVGGFADVDAAHLTGNSLQVAADTTNPLYATAGAAKLTMTNGAELVLTGGIELGRKKNRHGILELDNAAVVSQSGIVYVGWDTTTPGEFGTGELHLKNGASLTAVNVVVNTGSTATVESGSSLRADVANNGVVNVSGAVDLSGNFTGNAINFSGPTQLSSTGGFTHEAGLKTDSLTEIGAGSYQFSSLLFDADAANQQSVEVTFASGADVRVSGVMEIDRRVNDVVLDAVKGSIRLEAGASVTVGTESTNTGKFYNKVKSSTMVDADAVLTVYGEFQNKGEVTVNGTLNLYSVGGLGESFAGRDKNNGTVSVSGGIVNYSDTASSSGWFGIGAKIHNSGWEDVTEAGSRIVISDGGSLNLALREENSYEYAFCVGTGAELKLDGSQGAVSVNAAGVSLLNNGAITMNANSTVTVAALQNNGTISMDYNSTLAFGSFENAGTISITLDGYCGGEKKLLLDYTGSETLTGEYYSKLLGSSWNDACFTVENNDLYLNYDSAVVVYVNSTYSEENCGGHTWGVDAFADHESAMAKNPVRVVSCGGEFSSTVALNSKEGQIDGGTYKPLLAGHLVNTDVKNWDDHEGNLTVRINDGTFTSNVIGADGVAGGSSERTGNVSMTISGGTFSKQVAGGMYLAHTDSRGSVILTGDIDLTISGGTFDGRIYGGNFGINDTVSGRMSMKGNINLTIDAGKALTVNEHISAGSRGRGTVDGNVTVTVTGNGDNLTFDGLLFGGSSGDLYRTNNGVRTADTSVTGDRKLVFDGFSNGFDGTVSMFESVRFAGGSSVAFTNAALNLSDISNWDFEFGSSLSGVNRNNFAGDTLNFDLTGWAGDQWEVMSGSASAFSGWNDASRVTLGGESAAWDSDISGWCSSNYQLTLEEDGDGRKWIIAGKLA